MNTANHPSVNTHIPSNPGYGYLRVASVYDIQVGARLICIDMADQRAGMKGHVRKATTSFFDCFWEDGATVTHGFSTIGTFGLISAPPTASPATDADIQNGVSVICIDPDAVPKRFLMTGVVHSVVHGNPIQFSVCWSDGTTGLWTESSSFSLLIAQQVQPSPGPVPADWSELTIGTSVECIWGGSAIPPHPRYGKTGTISAVPGNGTFEVVWDDGDQQHPVWGLPSSFTVIATAPTNPNLPITIPLPIPGIIYANPSPRGFARASEILQRGEEKELVKKPVIDKSNRLDAEEERCWALMRPRLNPGECSCGCPKELCQYHKE